MALETYNAKRDFTRTAEPQGKTAAGEGGLYVIQKHDARRLHYDLRLELDGVLKSWAVTRGPSLDPAEKRLAVEVEDHPLDYATFEGTIPKGQYGGGSVIVWDKGRWRPDFDPHAGLKKGHLEFELEGEKLHGRWHLIRMKPRRGEKRINWLLIKAEDGDAREAGDILKEAPRSVASGRTVEEVGKGLGSAAKASKATVQERTKVGKTAPLVSRAAQTRQRKPESTTDRPGPTERKGGGSRAGKKPGRKEKLPDFIEPMLATLVAHPPAGGDWLHEIKFDGYRLLARLEKGKVRLLTRSGLDWTERFSGPLTGALEALAVTAAMIDGELVVEKASGASDFGALQADLSGGRADRFVYYAFDLLHLDGYGLRALPLVERKAALERLVPREGPVRFSAHFDNDGADVLEHACGLRLEGIVSKRAASPYVSGRGRDWVKAKCASRQEFVIGGFTQSSATPQAIGSLALGVQEAGALRHVGRVGTGFTAEVAHDLWVRLTALETDDSPFSARLDATARRGLHYVRPELVAEVEFRAWTSDGRLRHAAFRGLREDKPVGDILREEEAVERPASVELTHPDRVYWPAEGVTKADLADYYTRVWPRIAPFVTGRALALLRCPEGIEGPSFFQKHAWRGIPEQVHQVKDPNNPEEPFVAIDDLDGLIALVQSAVLEIHPWGSTLQSWEKPDMIVMDLDPGEGVAWPDIVSAAGKVRERLEEAGLAAFVKTSGGKGLHVVAPLTPKATWPSVKSFTKSLAEAMAADEPEHFVATISKARRKGRILIDYLRNQRGMTAVAPYSTRARPGAAVSMPVPWEALPGIGPQDFTVLNIADHLASDPWETFRASAKPLPTRRR
ncbi:DNA ligase D [Haematobacter genomosp. 1]|uniref:DNA ligase (ATP) n=1 Tax=Haematobacter genomosp. 1 TaxID=366618 RepID=A0A212ACX8_9RHOB|nr:DNA ligase D [Haematobacter genomosp. 1]OWJ78886.1 DNA ligase D [Haematobacter genomosp. 1]